MDNLLDVSKLTPEKRKDYLGKVLGLNIEHAAKILEADAKFFTEMDLHVAAPICLEAAKLLRSSLKEYLDA